MTHKVQQESSIGLVLSGGGARGFAHLGVLEAMLELGIRPSIIGGVSAGSIVGALFSDGKSPAEAFEILTSKSIFKFVKVAFPRKGFVKMDAFESMMRVELNTKNIEDLSVPLKIFATNINTANLEAFDEGDLVDAIIASCSIPVVFAPRKINGQFYLDGGLVNNFPAEIIKKHCKTLIGVNANPIGYEQDFSNLKKIAERCFHIFVRNQASFKNALCDYYIEPAGLEKFSIMNSSRAREIFKLGYEEAIKMLANNSTFNKAESL